MAPKKRGRKAKPKETAVPPKKRKGVLEPNSEDLDSRGELIPEWLKVSIQLLLINFHHEGVALLNSIESEFSALYKDTKVDPSNYDFPDWESMLRSPQFKQHCFIFTDKKLPCVKGYPLPRTAAISMRHNRWEIRPQIEPFQTTEVDQFTQTRMLRNQLLDISDVEQSTQTDEDIAELTERRVVVEKNLEMEISGISPIDSENSRTDDDDDDDYVMRNEIPVIPHTEPEEAKDQDIRVGSPESQAMPKLTSMTPSPSAKMRDTFDSIRNSVFENPSSSPIEEHRYYPSGRRRRHGSIDNSKSYKVSTFFRRSDVPESWARSVEEDEPRDFEEIAEWFKANPVTNNETEERPNSEPKDLIIDEDPESCPESSDTPPPPHLDPVIPCPRPVKIALRKQSISRSPKKRYLSQKHAKSLENSVRTISESSNSPTSNISSPIEDSEDKAKSVEAFLEWRFTPVVIQRPFEVRVVKQEDIHPESKIGVERDPRLAPGILENSVYFCKIPNTVELGIDPRGKTTLPVTPTKDSGIKDENETIDVINQDEEVQGMQRLSLSPSVQPNTNGYPTVTFFESITDSRAGLTLQFDHLMGLSVKHRQFLLQILIPK